VRFQPSQYGLSDDEAQRLLVEQGKRELTAEDCSPQGQAHAIEAVSAVVAFVGVPAGVLLGALVGGWKGALAGGALGYGAKYIARPTIASQVQAACAARKA
jgi:hypothetical protein